MFEKIFWLEDNPDFLQCFSELALSYGLKLNTQDLLSRTEFAFSFNHGKDIIEKGTQFDLHILDADFPNDVLPRRAREIQRFLEETKKGSGGRLEFVSDRQIYDNFIRFHREFLKEKRTIVYSMSYGAIGPAFKLGLPFYNKSSFELGEGEKIIKEYLLSSKGQFAEGLDKEAVAKWEVGGTPELIQRYLVND